MKEDFVLPEKWCILSKGEEHHNELLLEWLKKMKYEYPDWDGDDYYYHVWKSDITSATVVRNYDYTQLTDEQFKQCVLGMKEQQKEIVGWRFKSGCEIYRPASAEIASLSPDSSCYIEKYLTEYPNGDTHRHLKQAGVLDLWFEQVYKKEEPEYKVGDAIVVTNPDSTKSCGLEKDKLYWIIKIAKDNFYDGEEYCSVSNVEGGSRISRGDIKLSGIRKATPEEVKAAQTPQITINGYKGEFFEWGVKFGCAEIDKDLIINLYNTNSIIYRGTRTSFESVTIGKGTFTKEQIKAIAEYYLNKK